MEKSLARKCPKRFRFLFAPLDVNGDGVLDFEEVKALQQFQ